MRTDYKHRVLQKSRKIFAASERGRSSCKRGIVWIAFAIFVDASGEKGIANILYPQAKGKQG